MPEDLEFHVLPNPHVFLCTSCFLRRRRLGDLSALCAEPMLLPWFPDVAIRPLIAERCCGG